MTLTYLNTIEITSHIEIIYNWTDNAHSTVYLKVTKKELTVPILSNNSIVENFD